MKIALMFRNTIMTTIFETLVIKATNEALDVKI